MKKQNRPKRTKSFVIKSLRHALVGLMALLVFAGFLWASDLISQPEMPRSGEPAVLYSQQMRNDLRQTMCGAIQEARQEVVLMVYTLTDTTVIQTLNDKSEQGVTVKVICDGRACPFMERKLKPAVQLVKRCGDGLMHLKILIIDGKKVWIGSANMTSESLGLHPNLVVAVEHQALSEWLLAKSKELPEEGRSETRFRHQTFDLTDQSLEFWLLPDDREAIGRIKQLIREAKKSVRVAMFTWTRFDFAQEIVDATLRGVKAEVLLDHYSGKGVSAKVAKFLKEKGVFVALSQGKALLHHKFMVIDDTTMVCGSANWTKAAFTKNDDCFIVLNPLTEEQRIKIDRMWDVLKSEAAQ